MEIRERFDTSPDDKYLSTEQREALMEELFSDLPALTAFLKQHWPQSFKLYPGTIEFLADCSDLSLEMVARDYLPDYTPVPENAERQALHAQQREYLLETGQLEKFDLLKGRGDGG